MPLFNFNPKSEPSKDYNLEELPVFSSLPPSELRKIQQKARLEEYHRGDSVYLDGSPSEFFYVVLSGKFKIFKKRKGFEGEDIRGYLYRGEHFGETSLLTGQPHSANAVAMRDGILLKIPRDDFQNLLKDYPSISLHLNRSFGYRLTRDANYSGSREVKVAAFVSLSGGDLFTEFWFDLGTRLVQETKSRIILLDFEHQEDAAYFRVLPSGFRPFDLDASDGLRDDQIRQAFYHHPSGFDYLKISSQASSELYLKKITNLMTLLSLHFHFILIRLPVDSQHRAYGVLTKTDGVYFFQASRDQYQKALMDRVQAFERDYGIGKRDSKLIIVDGNLDQVEPSSTSDESLPVFSRIPSKSSYADRYWNVMRFIARDFAGKLIGLALGSGAAYGLSHIGVFKVLEENNIYPDMIAGSSIGALLGGLWAAGFRSHEIEAIARSLDKRTAFLRLIGFRDLDLFTKGFLKGDQVKRFLHHYLKDVKFEDLRMALKIVAADLFTSETVILDTGSVVDAIRASISIPGIFSPVTVGHRTLIDGGVLDPLPIRVLNRYGVKNIIAIHVLAGYRDRTASLQRDTSRSIPGVDSRGESNPLKKMFRDVFQQNQKNHSVNILNVIMNTIQFMEFEIADAWAREADVLIHPAVVDAHWAEFYSAEKFIRAGETKTREQLDEIKKLIAD